MSVTSIFSSASGIRRRSLVWWTLGVLIAIGSTRALVVQHASLDTFAPSVDTNWFLRPHQRNAIFGLPAVGGTIEAIAATPGGEAIWALVSNTMVIRSTDRGRTWEELSVPPDARDALQDIFFLDSRHGWISGDGLFLHTTDGGAGWRRIATAPSGLRDLHFIDSNRGWAVINGKLVTTRDSGTTWTDAPPPFPSMIGGNPPDSVRDFTFDSAGRGFCLAYDDTYVTTNDFGVTWSRPAALDPHLSPNSLPPSPPSSPGTASRTASSTPKAPANVQNFKQTPLTPDNKSPAPTPLYVVAIELDAQGLATLWCDNGTTLRQRRTDTGDAWDIQTRALSLDSAIDDLVPLGNGSAIATTEAISLVLVSPFDAKPLLFGIGPALCIDHGRDTTGVPVWWIGGHAGLLLSSADGGKTWRPVANPIRSTIISLYFRNASLGWVGTLDGQIFRTRDGGATWQALASPRDDAILSIFFRDENTGVVATDYSEIDITTDGGKTWAVHQTTPQQTVSVVAGAGGDLVDLGSGDGGSDTVLRFDLERKTFSAGVAALPPHDKGYRYLQTFDNDTIFAHGFPGPLLARAPGQTHFKTRNAQVLLSASFLDDARKGLALTLHGGVLVTSDGGSTWKSASATPLTLPAPWYWFSWLLVGLCFWRALQRNPDLDHIEHSIVPRAVADSPLAAHDLDALGIGEIARGLSRFFRNRATVGPFTVAVSGAWGSGKTSFMRLLHDDLVQHDVRPVWFNAWHQQHEEHYLPALLESIVTQAVPPVWDASGWRFRARLIIARLWKARLRIFWLAAIAVLCASVLFHQRAPLSLDSALKVLADTWASLRATLGLDADSSASAGSSAVKTTLYLGGAGSLLLLVRELVSTFKAFGVDPAALLATARSSQRAAATRISFQRQFAGEFSEVTVALGAVPLVIFIDDLDRCKPEKTVEMLEAINYLVASGSCFVVMGLAKAQIEACVGLGYKDISSELAAQQDAAVPTAHGSNVTTPPLASPETTNDALASAARRHFARHYLEKLINLEIPIPPPNQNQHAVILSGRSKVTSDDSPPSTWQRWIHRIAVQHHPQLKRGLFTAMLALSILASTWQTGKLLAPLPPPAARPANELAVSTNRNPTLDTEMSAGQQPNDPKALPGASASSSLPAPELRNAGIDDADAELLLVAIVIGVVSFGGLLTQRGQQITKDSPKFVVALEDWAPVIAASHPTPRALKRFVNRLRYLAMQQTAEAPPPSLIERARAWTAHRVCGLQPPNPLTDARSIPEEILVALAAIASPHPHQTPDSAIRQHHAEAAKIAQAAMKPDDRARFDERYPFVTLLQHAPAFRQLVTGALPKA